MPIARKGTVDQKSFSSRASGAALAGDLQSHSERANNLHHRVEVGVAVFGESFIQPFAGHADLARQLAHVAGAGNVAESGANQTSVPQVFFESRLKIEAGIFCSVQMICDIPAGECLSHGLPPVFCQSPGALYIAGLHALLTAAEQNNDFCAVAYVVESITRSVMDTHFEYASANRLYITKVAKRDISQTGVNAGNRTVVP